MTTKLMTKDETVHTMQMMAFAEKLFKDSAII
jgi:regulatory protein YycH of two-component signal transduction system YycFG